jgi:Fic family protein
MAYTEIQKRGKKRYYYLAHTIRTDTGSKKVRVFLGVNLSKEKIDKEIAKKNRILKEKILVFENLKKEKYPMPIDFSKKILIQKHINQLKKLGVDYKNSLKISDKDVLRQVRESFLIRYTYDTNAAEGNTISLKETELILKKEILPKSHKLREVHEIENTVTAYQFIENYKKELNHKFILKIHNLLTKSTLLNNKNEGRYRIKGQNVMMTGSKHFQPKGGKTIKKLMNEIIEKYYQCKLSKLEAAIYFHSAFIAIHPFIDGNGRVSRLLFNWMLIQEGMPPVNFPSVEHIEYTDLMELSRDGDTKPLATHIFEKILNHHMSTKMIK